jgi:hypothetical protein
VTPAFETTDDTLLDRLQCAAFDYYRLEMGARRRYDAQPMASKGKGCRYYRYVKR